MDPLIKKLNQANVRYLLIGGQAVRLHGLPRFSMDWDFFIPPRDENNFKVISSVLGDDLDVELEPLGARGSNIIQTYQTIYGIIQFHLVVPGLTSFDEAESRLVKLVDETGLIIRCLCAEDLLASKLATHRAQDEQDIMFLREKLRVRG